MNLWTVFLTGLTTGGLTCLAVQGGLLAGYLATRRQEVPGAGFRITLREALIPTAAFLSAKLIAYTLLGALLGLVGSTLQVSLAARIALQIAAGIFMLLTAFQLFGVKSLRRLELRPPAFLRRLVRKQAKAEHLFVPILLGLFTLFIPCGTTQAMEVFAVSSGSVVTGAAILFLFVLGTVPLFVAVGVLSRLGSTAFQSRLKFATAVIVLGLGLFTVNAGLTLADSPFRWQNVRDTYLSAVFGIHTAADEGSPAFAEESVGAVQEVTITASNRGYTPNRIALKAGVPARIKLVTEGNPGCASVFIVPKYGIEKVLSQKGSEEFEFTPEAPGRITFSCGMGMFTGEFLVES